MTTSARATFAGVAKLSTGVFYCASHVTLADITDGTTNTYLIGEKYLNPDCYATGTDGGDNESAMIGDDIDVIRWTALSGIDPQTGIIVSPYPPLQDSPGVTYVNGFGSAHANGFQMAFCDGSVQMLNYSIDPQIHGRLGNRKDGLPVDGKKF